MKGLLLALITSCSLAAGFVYGYLEMRRDRATAPATPAPSVSRVPPPSPSATKTAPPTPEPKKKAAAPKAPPGPGPEELAAAVKSVDDFLRKEDFDGARKAAEEFLGKLGAESGEGGPALEIRQRVRKIEAYRAIIAGQEKRELPEVLYDVQLESGGRFTAKTRKETADRWDFEHVLGGVSSHRKSQVSVVLPIPRKKYLDARWKEIQDGVAGRTDPFDIYFFGVKKCFRLGLRQEGIGLLDRLLGLADSATVISVIGGQDPAIARAWEEAGGRKAGPAEAAPTAKPGEVAAVPPGEAPPTVASKEEPEPAEGPGDDEIDVEALKRAGELIAEAEKMIRDARGIPEKLFDARIRLQSAAKLLYGLQQGPFDPRIGEMTRKLRPLLEQVMGEKE